MDNDLIILLSSFNNLSSFSTSIGSFWSSFFPSSIDNNYFHGTSLDHNNSLGQNYKNVSDGVQLKWDWVGFREDLTQRQIDEKLIPSQSDGLYNALLRSHKPLISDMQNAGSGRSNDHRMYPVQNLYLVADWTSVSSSYSYASTLSTRNCSTTLAIGPLPIQTLGTGSFYLFYIAQTANEAEMTFNFTS